MTIKNNLYSCDQAARCLMLIKNNGPILAAALAERLGFVGERETLRRKIRAIVQHLRNDCGEMIVADSVNGYYLTEDEKVWQDYLNGRQIDAKKILGITGKQLKMVTDSRGQGLLFVPGSGQLNNEKFNEVRSA
ncbi:MAG: hypothetical protein A2Y12_08820 [Planctomycetes bacterium GWF2_42_9]|nr:MAG: hypothetical protein A2Y12_08820 [Planctomycetes bacterium GWF2_42_9]HAL45500.1 hypothetical protein [Phycisphaerales bacterium]